MIYLDYNASAPLLSVARGAVMEALDIYANPSSPHGFGRKARSTIEQARRTIIDCLGADAHQGRLIFTAHATEANTLALHGRAWTHILVAPTNHDSLFLPVQRQGSPIVYHLDVAADGLVDPAHLYDTMTMMTRQGSAVRLLVALTWAQNEIGTYYTPEHLAALCAVIEREDAALHIDATQALGKIPFSLASFCSGVAWSLAVSSHKIGGPKGAGALYTTMQGMRPFGSGGGQEYGIRHGSENMSAIVGFAAAVAQVCSSSYAGLWRHWQLWRDGFENAYQAFFANPTVIAAGFPRLPNTSCFSVYPFLAETVLIALDLENIALSRGSACTVAKAARSRTLAAMKQDALTDYTLRASCGHATGKNDFMTLATTLQNVTEQMRQIG